MKRTTNRWSRRTIAFLLSAALMASSLVIAVGVSDSSNEVSENDLTVVVGEAVDGVITVSAGNTLISSVTTNPETVTVGIGCGGCAGGCNDTCSDKWGFCQCSGSTIVTPTISLTDSGDSDVASVMMNNGELYVEGVADGSTTITFQASFSSYDSMGIVQGTRVTKPVTVTVNVSDAPGKEKLSTPSNLVLSGSTLSWDAVDNATQYLVKAVDKYTSSYWTTKTITGTSIDLLDFSSDMRGGDYTFNIYACPDSSSQSWGTSDAASADYTLPAVPFDAPTGVEYNPISKKVSWNAVDGISNGNFQYQCVLVPVGGGDSINVWTTTGTQGYMNTPGTNIPPGEYYITIQALGKEAQNIWVGIDFDTWEDIYQYIPAQYSNSPLSDPAATTYTKKLAISAASYTVDGKTIILTSNYLLDSDSFDPADSGVALTVNGVSDPLVSMTAYGTSGNAVALTFQNAIESPTDDISLILSEGSLQGVGGYAFDDYDVISALAAIGTTFSPSKLADGYTGVISGSSSTGYTADNTFALAAKYSSSTDGIAVDGEGNIYVADTGNYAVRKIDAATGLITTVAGNHTAPSGATAIVSGVSNATEVALTPDQIALDDNGNLYITSNITSQNYVYKVDLNTGKIFIIAGTGASPAYTNGVPEDDGDGGLATAALLSNPTGIALDSSGNIYVAEWSGNVIRKIDAQTGIITTIAGTGSSWTSVTGTTAEINAANGIGTAPATGTNMRPDNIQIVGDVLYFADYSSSSYQVRKIDLNVADPADLKVEVVAGAPHGSTDAAALPATASSDGIDPLSVLFPTYSISVTADADGNVYFINKSVKGAYASNKSSIYMISAKDGLMYQLSGSGSSSISNYTTTASSNMVVNASNIVASGGSLYYTQSSSGSGLLGVYMMNPIDPTQEAAALSTPANVKVTGNTVSWNKVTNAMYYDVAITPKSGGDTITQRVTKATSLDLTSLTAKLPLGSYNITVTAVPVSKSATYLSSPVSAAVAYDAVSYKADHVVISEVYGGGGSENSLYKNDYVELYNPTDEPVSLDSWSLQVYNSDTGSSLGAFALSGYILPHSYYLIQGAGGDTGEALPDADITDESVDIMPLVARVALVDHPQGLQGVDDTHLVDLVAVSGTLYEGAAAATKPASMLQSIVRKDNSGIDAAQPGAIGNGWDTDYNKNDFILSDTPTPQNSASAEPSLISAVSGSVSLDGTYRDGSITAVPSYSFTDSSYAAASIAQINYYWYADGELISTAVNDAALSTDHIAAGTTLKAAIQLIYKNGMANQMLYSDEMTLTNPEPEKGAPEIVSYTASTDHGGDVISGLDDQWINLTVTFDTAITITDEEDLIDELKFMLNGSETLIFGNEPNTDVGTDYPGYVTVSLGEDQKSLNFKIHFGFAPYAGYLTVTAPYGISTILDADTGLAAEWSDIDLYVPNGVKLETASQTAGDPDNDIQASVTKTVIAPTSSTRGMVHMLFLKNGVPVGELNSYGANVTTHYHNYLALNATSFAAMIPGFMSKFSADYEITADGDTITITAKNSEEGDVLDLRIYAYPYDRTIETDTSTLSAKMDYAASLDASDYTPETYAAMSNTLAIARSIAGSSYYSQDEVDTALVNLNSALNLLEAAEPEPNSSAPNSSTPDSSTPDSSAPDSSTPDSSTPDSSTPDSSTPDSSTPDSSAPDSSAPDSSTPDSSTPDSSIPDSSIPDSSTPDSSAPDSSNEPSSEPDTTSEENTTSIPDSSESATTSTGSSNPKTGDVLPLAGIALLFIAGAGIAITARRDGKKLKNK